MKYTLETKNFFTQIPELDTQFGNLITIRKKKGLSFPGLPECFVSSIMQFQPLFQAEVFDKEGKKLTLTETYSSTDPIKKLSIFSSKDLKITQVITVKENTAFLEMDIKSSIDITILFTGSCLFSPQGIPYHWEEEGNCKLDVINNQILEGKWDNLSFNLSVSKPMESISVSPLYPVDIAKSHYFTSHNLKKRYTFWVNEEIRRKAKNLLNTSVTSRNSFYCFKWNPKLNDSLSVEFSLDNLKTKTTPTLNKSILDAQNNEISRWNIFTKTIPQFDCDDTQLEKIYYTSWYILFAGKIKFPEERMKFPFTSVNKFHYYNQFFWDSAFQTIAWLWNNDSTHAEQEMKNFVLNQWRNGMIPYELFMYPTNGREWMDGDAKTSGTTQPPVIGITINEVYKKFGNKDYLEFFYNSLLAYDNWLTLYRDLGNRGLSAYTNIWESGWDNSPRFDEATRNRVLDPFIEGVDFNTYIYLMRQTIIKMAKILGKEEPKGLIKKQEQTKKSMNTLMYNSKDGFYYDLEAGTNKKILVKTAAGLLPLMTDIPTKEQKDRLIQEYLLSDEEFFTKAPIPSVSKSENSYCSYDFWRGANWPQITWSILYGIESSHPDAAAMILNRFLSSTIHNNNCYEYYDAENGDGAGLPFHGWGALYTDFIIRFVVGIHPNIDGFNFHIIETKYNNFSIKNLNIHGLNLAIKRNKTTICITIKGFGEFTFPSSAQFSLQEENKKLVIIWDKNYQLDVKVTADYRWKTQKELVLSAN